MKEENYPPISETRVKIPKLSQSFGEAIIRAYALEDGKYLITTELLDCPPGSGSRGYVETGLVVPESERYTGHPFELREADPATNRPPTASDIEDYFVGYTAVGALHIGSSD